jgi:hypothetical protein
VPGGVRGGAGTGLDRAWYWIAVLAALAAVVAGVAIAYLGATADRGPAGTVADYFAALRRGDAPAALALGDVPDGPHDLLTSAVLAEQQRLAPIEAVSIGATDRTGSRASVTVRYRLGFPGAPRQVTDTVPTVERGGRWQLARTVVAVTLRLTQAVDRASVLGAPLPDGTTLLFPGAVPVRFDSPYLALAPGSAVSFAGPGEDDLQVQVTPAGRAAVLGAVATALRRCVQAGADPRCPLPSERFVPGSLRGSVGGDLADRLTLSVPPGAEAAIRVAGQVRFTGRWRALTFENVAVARSGEVELPVAAAVPAVAPLRVAWQETT